MKFTKLDIFWTGNEYSSVNLHSAVSSNVRDIMQTTTVQNLQATDIFGKKTPHLAKVQQKISATQRGTHNLLTTMKYQLDATSALFQHTSLRPQIYAWSLLILWYHFSPPRCRGKWTGQWSFVPLHQFSSAEQLFTDAQTVYTLKVQNMPREAMSLSCP